MYVKYGSYRFSDNDCNLVSFARLPIYANSSAGYARGRGFRIGTKYVAHLRFQLRTSLSGQAAQNDLYNKQNAVISAFSINDQDFALYRDDGTPTHQQLSNGHPDALSGVKVISRSWPIGNPAEYATVRTGDIVLEQEYFDIEQQVITYVDTIQVTGDAGPLFVPTTGLLTSRFQQVSSTSPVKIVQEGFAIGRQGYVMTPPAIFPGPPQFISTESWVWSGYPYRDRLRFKDWETRWRYTMREIVSVSAAPFIVY